MDKPEGKKHYGDCPTCGSTLEIYNGGDGTNSFVSVNLKQLREGMQELLDAFLKGDDL